MPPDPVYETTGPLEVSYLLVALLVSYLSVCCRLSFFCSSHYFRFRSTLLSLSILASLEFFVPDNIMWYYQLHQPLAHPTIYIYIYI